MAVVCIENKRVVVEKAYTVACDQCGKHSGRRASSQDAALPELSWIILFPEACRSNPMASPPWFCSWSCASAYAAERAAENMEIGA